MGRVSPQTDVDGAGQVRYTTMCKRFATEVDESQNLRQPCATLGVSVSVARRPQRETLFPKRMKPWRCVNVLRSEDIDQGRTTHSARREEPSLTETATARRNAACE